MTPAAAAILEGMPDPRLLHRADGDGTTWILAGSVVLACYPSGDAGLRNVTVAVCRQLGFGGRAVAAGGGGAGGPPRRRAGPGRGGCVAQPVCGGGAGPRLPGPDRRGGGPGGRAAARPGRAAL